MNLHRSFLGLPLPLLALAVASFGIGTTEFVIMGLLPEVARDLHVSIPKAGLLVSGYALGVAVGAPLLAILTSALSRRRALLFLMLLFIIGNVLCGLSPSYWFLMAARIVTSFCHGTFFGLGAVVAAEVVAPNKKAQAISLMFAGLTLANVLGVPFGTGLGQSLGWRTTFFTVAGIGLVAEASLFLWLPKNLLVMKGNLVDEFKILGRPQVILAMVISILASASLFSVFTYIAPLLQQVTGVSPRGTTTVLLIFGVGLTVGNYLGGRLGDWKLMPSVMGLFVCLLFILALFTKTSFVYAPAVATIFIWGVLAFALVSPLQMRVVNEAHGAVNLASILNQGAFNLGNATGAWVGGVALTQGIAYSNIPWIGFGIVIIALALTAWSYRMEKQNDPSPV